MKNQVIEIFYIMSLLKILFLQIPRCWSFENHEKDFIFFDEIFDFAPKFQSWTLREAVNNNITSQILPWQWIK